MADNISSKDDLPLDQESGMFVYLINIFLVVIIVYLIYKILRGQQTPNITPSEPELPKMKKQDFTVEELRAYDGTGPDKRILIAVNSKVFDVTKGHRFYGPEGPYAAFAGR
jgi:Cytochrome b5-like Heme/Steroid binding domain.